MTSFLFYDSLYFMNDTTENARKALVGIVNSTVQSDNKDSERKRLESIYGTVWDAKELSNQFEILGFMAPFVVVKNRTTGEKGSLMFQHSPRFYFNFKAD